MRKDLIIKSAVIKHTNRILLVAATIFLVAINLGAQDEPPALVVNWNNVIMTSKTTPTLQVVENPAVRPSSPIHANVFKALKDLGADYVRYVPWFPYPKMVVAELKPPTKDSTFWDLLTSTAPWRLS